MPDLLLVGGPAGSKSTFIGGLYHYIKRRDEVSVQYEMETGSKSEFTDNVLKMMGQRKAYPGETHESYAVKFKIKNKSTAIPDTIVRFMDIPGQQQLDAIDEIEEEINEDRIETKFREQGGVEDKLNNENKALQAKDDDWKILYKYTYLTCDQVIFLLNMHKLIMESEDPIYDAHLLEKAAGQKRRCALIPMAVDILQYDPSNSKVNQSLINALFGPFGAGSRMADETLLQELQQQINVAVSPEANNIITTAQNNHKIDVFATAVPAEAPHDDTNDNLVDDGVAVKTQGFDQVVEWLRG